MEKIHRKLKIYFKILNAVILVDSFVLLYTMHWAAFVAGLILAFVYVTTALVYDVRLDTEENNMRFKKFKDEG